MREWLSIFDLVVIHAMQIAHESLFLFIPRARRKLIEVRHNAVPPYC